MSTGGVSGNTQLLYFPQMGIGKRIQARLNEIGWQRKDLMDHVDGLTPQALSNLIKRDSARSEWDEEIAKALGLHVMELVYGRPAPDWGGANVTTLPIQDAGALPATVQKIVELTKSMTREGQYVLLGRAEELALKYPATKANQAQ